MANNVWSEMRKKLKSGDTNWDSLGLASFEGEAPPTVDVPARVAYVPVMVNNEMPEGSVCFDIETGSVDVMWSTGPEFLRLFGHSVDDGPVINSPFPSVLLEDIRDHGGWIITHNGNNFDSILLDKHCGLSILKLAQQERLRDTKLIAFLADPPYSRTKEGEIEKIYSLESVGTKYLGHGKMVDVETGKSVLKRLAAEFGGYEKIPQDHPEYNEYLKRDVEVTRDLVKVLPMNDYVIREHKIAAVAATVSIQGFRVDIPLLEERIRLGEEKRLRILTELQEYGLPGPETTKAPQMTKVGKAAIDRAFREAGVELPRTKSGSPALGKEILQEIVETAKEEEAVSLAEAVMGLNGIRTIYLNIHDNLVNDRVHPSINLRQSTGRWSIQKPGLTVIGKRDGKVIERAVFLPDDENHVLISADLSQIDARAVAALSQDYEYLKMFEKGKDFHSEIAEQVFGDRNKRELAKPVTHGWAYGMKPKKLSLTTGLSFEEAEEFDRTMSKKFPVLVKWQDSMREQGEVSGVLYNGFGRMMRIESERAFTQCVPLNSEILTRNGWKTWDQIDNGLDETLGLDDNGNLTWTPIIGVNQYSNQEVVKLSKKFRFEVECTPNHKWVSDKDFGNGRTGHWHKRIMVETSNLKTTDRLVLSAVLENKTELPELTLNDAEIIGWVLGDGTLTWHKKTSNAYQNSVGQFVRFDIVQCKPIWVEHLRNLITGSSEVWTEYGPTNTDGIYDKYTFTLRPKDARGLLQRAELAITEQQGSKGDLDLIQFVLKMDRLQREAFLNGFWGAEGYMDKNNKVYCQNPGPILDAIQLAILLQGQLPSYSSGNNKLCKEVRGTNPHVGVQGMSREPSGVKDVWCPTTGLGTWVMRQNGKIMLTGNSPALQGQSTARDLLMEGILRLWYMAGEDVVKMIRAVVHDELVMSCHKNNVEEIEHLVIEAMSFSWCPEGGNYPVEITAGLNKRGSNWAGCYCKGCANCE